MCVFKIDLNLLWSLDIFVTRITRGIRKNIACPRTNNTFITYEIYDLWLNIGLADENQHDSSNNLFLTP